MNYFFLFYFIILGIIGIRTLYNRYQFIQYCEAKYPEKASEFLSLGEFTLTRSLFRKHDIDDEEFVRLKNKAKNSYAGLYLAVLVGIFFVLIIVLMPFLMRN